MGRKKKSGAKMPPQSFKKFLPKERVKRMSSDLSRIEQDINEVRMEAKVAVDKFNEYHQVVAGQIKEVLVEAGVFDEVAEMETARTAAHQKLTEKLKVLQVRVDDLLKVRSYLVKGGESVKAEAPVAQATPESSEPEVTVEAVEAEPEVEAPVVAETPVVVEPPAAKVKKARAVPVAPEF